MTKQPQARFRHRNVLQPDGNLLKFEQLSTTTCTVAPTWTPYYSAVQGVNYQKIDHMDDISGDRPTPKQGPSGYRFHPMTKVTGTFEGNSDAAWLVRNIAQQCVGYPLVFNEQFRRAGSANAARDLSGIGSFPMIGDRVDVGQFLPQREIDRLVGLTSTRVHANRGKLGESNLYESLAEMDKTLGMFKDIFDRARKIQDAIFFKKGGVAKLRSLSKEAAGQYLATRYGFAPLIKDLQAIIAGLDKQLGKKLIATRAQETWRSVTNTALTDVIDAGTVGIPRTLRTDELLTVRAMALDEVELTLMKVLGLGWKDLMTVPWELKSYSFVLDWFVNLGDYLSWFVPDVGLSPIGSCITVEYLRVDTVSYGSPYLLPSRTSYQTLTSASAPGSFTRSLKYKVRYSMPPIPSLQWQSDFKFDRLLRALDAVALFTQQTSKIKATGGLLRLMKSSS